MRSGDPAGEQATVYAAVLPLIASGEIVPARDRPFGTVTLTVGA